MAFKSTCFSVLIAICALGVHFVLTIPINNGVVGFVSEVQCSVRGSTINNQAGMTLPFDQCGVRRVRQLNPPGIAISAVVIISFHPTFLTKVDRAYRINCFYMEAIKTVEQELLVSMLTTSLVTRQLQMPTCKYEILTENANGVPVRFAQIGDPVYHKWTCAADQPGVFCMRVHSCTVGDGQGGRPIMVINEAGCGIDRYILRNLEYTGDLSCGQEAHVFKFADRPALNFNCQIELSLRDKDAGCRNAQPVCETIGSGILANGNGTSRQTREISDAVVGNFDLPEQTMVVFELQDTAEGKEREDILIEDFSDKFYRKEPRTENSKNLAENAVCFTSSTFAGLVTVFVLSIVCCLSVFFLLFLFRKERNSGHVTKYRQES